MRVSRSIFFYFLLYWIVCGQVWKDKASRENSKGNAYYRQRSYSEALEKYVGAQDFKTPRPEISYNIANTLYQQKKYTEALKEYGKSVSSTIPGLDQKIYFNRGNSYYQMAQYQAAAESYQKALEMDPRDPDAKHNLELALKRLQEEQQKQNSKTSEKDQKKGENSPPENQDNSNAGKTEDKPKDQANRKPQGGRNSEAETQPNRGRQNPRPEGELNKGMDRSEALRILDAINDQEKKEQQKQLLKVQKNQPSGRDW
jgi:tetratricopeptide (TPR) repeat protein